MVLLFSADVFPCGNLACSPATARTHARTCALLRWCSGHSLLLSFLRLFLWHQPARLFSSLFAHGHLGGSMKFLGSTRSVALRSLTTENINLAHTINVWFYHGRFAPSCR